MVTSFQLFQLVKSLTKEEKRFFKLNSPYKQDPAAYLQLFDTLQNLPQWDETKLRQSLPNNGRNYPNLKRYLYDAILRSLILQHRQSDIYMELWYMLEQWHVLRQRALYQPASEILDQAEILANQADMTIFATQIQQAKLIMQTTIYAANPNDTLRNQDLDRQEQALQLALSNQAQHLQQYFLHYRLFTCTDTMNNQPKNILQAQLLPLYQSTQQLQSLSPSTQLLQLNNLEAIDRILNQPSPINYLTHILQIFQTYPHFKSYRLSYYTSALYNAIMSAIADLQFDLATQYLHQYNPNLPLFAKQSPTEKLLHQFNNLILLLAFHTKQHQYPAAQQLLLNAQNWTLPNLDILPQRDKYFLQFSIGLAFITQPHQALDAWEPLFTRPLPFIRPYQIHAYLLRLLLLWQLKDFPLLSYRLAQTRHFIRTQKANSSFNKALFLFIQRSITQPHRAPKALAVWRKWLSAYVCDEIVEPLSIFDYKYWAEHFAQP